MLCLFLSPPTNAATWTNTAGGDFDDAGNWDPNDVPDTNAENAELPVLTAGYVVTLTEGMFSSGLSNRVVLLNNADAVGNSVTLNASGTSGSPLLWTIGHPNLPTSSTTFLNIRRNALLNLNHVTITFQTTNSPPASNAGTYLNLRGASVTPAMLVASNSQIIMTESPAGAAGNNGLAIGSYAQMSMVDGFLRVTRPAGNAAGISVAGDGARLFLTDTEMITDNLAVGFNSIVEANHSSLLVTSKVNRTLSIQSGTANLNGGIFQIAATGSGNLQFLIPIGVGGSSTLNITNATVFVSNNGDVLMNPGGSHPGGPRDVRLNLHGTASLAARNALVGGNAAPSPSIDDYQVSMTGSNPQLLLSGNLALGSDKTGAGRLVMNSGGLVASNVLLGSSVGDGYYEQLGGTATISNRIVFQKGTTVGAQRFIVDDGATLTFLGLGMELAGAGSLLVDAADWDTDGSFIFAPVPSISTQQLIVAGQDIGGNVLGYNNNFALGSLDLSAYDAADRLLVLDAGTFADPALYVETISPIATNALISSIDIYYLPELNPLLYAGGDSGKYLLTGGGFLLPIPEPGTAALVLAGMGLLMIRQRSEIRN